MATGLKRFGRQEGLSQKKIAFLCEVLQEAYLYNIQGETLEFSIKNWFIQEVI